MERVGLVVNFRKARGGKFIQILTDWFTRRNIQVALPLNSIEVGSSGGVPCPDIKFAERVDLIITLGGDGTLLGTARSLAGSGIPILGVNLGHLGFLTDLEMADLFPCLERLLQGDYLIEKRMMLATEVRRGGETAASFHALNDVVITKGPLSRIIRLMTYVGDEYLATYRADGMIVASPTGSTAYSLSAGGPIVNPDLELLIVTPICPHTLYARPFILAENEVIRVVLRSDPADAMVTIDGQIGYPLQKNDQILVRKAQVYTNLLKIRKRSFFELLRLKLREGDH